MLNLARIKELSGQVETLTGQLAAASGNVAALQKEKEDFQARITELETAAEGTVAKADHETAINLRDEQISSLQAQVAAAAKDTEKKVEKGVVEGIAGAGVPAVKRDRAAVDNPASAPGNGQSARERLSAATKIAGSTK